MKVANAVRMPRIQLAVLLGSLAAHGLAVFLGLPADQALREGFLLLLILSAGLEAAGHFLSKVGRFRAVHAARGACLVGIAAICGGESLLTVVLLTTPYLVETPLFDGQRVAARWNGCAILAFALVSVVPGLLDGTPGRLAALGAIMVCGAFTAAIAHVAVHHREEHVRLSDEVHRLGSTVTTLADANIAFQLYANNIESESAEKERNRITRELHDTVGYALTNVIVMMDAAPLLLRDEPQALGGLFQNIRAQAEDALGETRRILRRLREFRPFERLGLHALAHLTRSFQGATGIEVQLNLGNLPWSLGGELDAALFRLVQEGLTNAFRHGKASRVRINMWMTRDSILTSVADNGRGVPKAGALAEGIGLSGMRERLAAFGGDLALKNLPHGFELLASIPYGMGGISGTDKNSDR